MRKRKMENTGLLSTLRHLERINQDNILALKDFLSTQWKPQTVSEAIVMKHIQHIMNNAKDHINTECAIVLDKCKHCDNVRIDTETGLKVLRKSKRSEKVYVENPRLEELENQMEELKKQIAEEKSRTEFMTLSKEGYDYVVSY
ncbi:MAG: hypothetical protein J5I47_08955 [Vicingus serpentipes]|nr:hypothetical protein [Vicingus serpentipes]